jgi:hypothetical protein
VADQLTPEALRLRRRFNDRPASLHPDQADVLTVGLRRDVQSSFIR